MSQANNPPSQWDALACHIENSASIAAAPFTMAPGANGRVSSATGSSTPITGGRRPSAQHLVPSAKDKGVTSKRHARYDGPVAGRGAAWLAR